ncbi:hypothetical protein ACHAW6_003411, partial [Cyclotella cf. meneghiniana]
NVSILELQRQADASDAAKYNKHISILTKHKSTFDPSLAMKIKTPSSLAIQEAPEVPHSKYQLSLHPLSEQTPKTKQIHSWTKMVLNVIHTHDRLLQNRLGAHPQLELLGPQEILQILQFIPRQGPPSGGHHRRTLGVLFQLVVQEGTTAEFTDKVMADAGVASYANRKFWELQMKKERRRGRAGGKG